MSSPMVLQVRASSLLHRLEAASGNPSTLDDIPSEYLASIAGAGFTMLYLLGVWTTGQFGLAHSAAAVRDATEVAHAAPASSPFAVYEYSVAESLGGDIAMHRFHARCNAVGLRLILDFIPNHLAADHPLGIQLRHCAISAPVGTHRGGAKLATQRSAGAWFDPTKVAPRSTEAHSSSAAPAVPSPGSLLQAMPPFVGMHEEPSMHMRKQNSTLDGSDSSPATRRVPIACIAHGGEGGRSAWHDTLQLNYFSTDLRRRMLRVLLKIACYGPDGRGLADGVRCDMAMLQLNERFHAAWSAHQPDGQRLACLSGKILGNYDWKEGQREAALASMRKLVQSRKRVLAPAAASSSDGETSSGSDEPINEADLVLQWQQEMSSIARDSIAAASSVGHGPYLGSKGSEEDRRTDGRDVEPAVPSVGPNTAPVSTGTSKSAAAPWWSYAADSIPFSLHEARTVVSYPGGAGHAADSADVLAEYWPVAITAVRAARYAASAIPASGARCTDDCAEFGDCARRAGTGSAPSLAPAGVAEEVVDDKPRPQPRDEAFFFMAEAYSDTEYLLQRCGFDWTYDKKLYDRLLTAVRAAPGEATGMASQSVLGHISGADARYSLRCVRFLENHDEQRAAAMFGPLAKSIDASTGVTIPSHFTPHFACAVAALIGCSGARFVHDGQMSGRFIKHSMHADGARHPEPVHQPTRRVYAYLLAAARRPEIVGGYRTYLPVRSGGESRDAMNAPDRVMAMLAWSYMSDSPLMEPSEKPGGARADYSAVQATLVLVNLSSRPAEFFLDWREALYERSKPVQDGASASNASIVDLPIGSAGTDGSPGSATQVHTDATRLPAEDGSWPTAACDAVASREPGPDQLAPPGLGFNQCLAAASGDSASIRFEDTVVPVVEQLHGAGVSTIVDKGKNMYVRPVNSIWRDFIDVAGGCAGHLPPGMWVRLDAWQAQVLAIHFSSECSLRKPSAVELA